MELDHPNSKRPNNNNEFTSRVLSCFPDTGSNHADALILSALPVSIRELTSLRVVSKAWKNTIDQLCTIKYSIDDVPALKRFILFALNSHNSRRFSVHGNSLIIAEQDSCPHCKNLLKKEFGCADYQPYVGRIGCFLSPLHVCRFGIKQIAGHRSLQDSLLFSFDEPWTFKILNTLESDPLLLSFRLKGRSVIEHTLCSLKGFNVTIRSVRKHSGPDVSRIVHPQRSLLCEVDLDSEILKGFMNKGYDDEQALIVSYYKTEEESKYVP